MYRQYRYKNCCAVQAIIISQKINKEIFLSCEFLVTKPVQMSASFYQKKS